MKATLELRVGTTGWKWVTHVYRIGGGSGLYRTDELMRQLGSLPGRSLEASAYKDDDDSTVWTYYIREKGQTVVTLTIRETEEFPR